MAVPNPLLPEKSRIYLKGVFRKRNQLIQQLQEFVDNEIDAAHFSSVVDIVRNQLVVRKGVIEDSLRYLLGRRLTSDELLKCAWRLAGNTAKLQRNMPVHAWTVQHSKEWVPLLIHSATIDEDKTIYSFKILSGTPCPMQISAGWSEKMIFKVSRKLGFTSDYGKLPLGNPYNMVGLLFIACLIPVLSKTRPMFAANSVDCTMSFLKSNKQLIAARSRSNMHCPFGYATNCWNCLETRDKCKFAVRV